MILTFVQQVRYIILHKLTLKNNFMLYLAGTMYIERILI